MIYCAWNSIAQSLYNIVWISICDCYVCSFKIGNSPLCGTLTTDTFYLYRSTSNRLRMKMWISTLLAERKEIPIIKIDDSNENLFPFFAIFCSYFFYWFAILLPVHPEYTSVGILHSIQYAASFSFIYVREKWTILLNYRE